MGYRPTGEIRRGGMVYQRGREYIVRDTGSHATGAGVGAWKRAHSIQALSQRGSRLGTYNRDLSVRMGSMTLVWSLQNHAPGEAQRIAHISEATPEEWRDLEGRYLTAITQQISDAGADRLRVHLDRSHARDVSALQRWAPDIGVRWALSYSDGESVAGARLEQFCRLCLRDLQGHGLSDAARGFFVFFGSGSSCLDRRASPTGAPHCRRALACAPRRP